MVLIHCVPLNEYPTGHEYVGSLGGGGGGVTPPLLVVGLFGFCGLLFVTGFCILV